MTVTTSQIDPTTALGQLTQPSPAYRRIAWLAVGSLALFIVLYFLLAGWFLVTAYRLTVGAYEPTFGGWLVGLCALFLAVFILKPVVFVKHGSTADMIEITREQQPRLFAFLHDLADRAAAPRPHRVFLSPRVNAAVFYDLSVLNLFFPSRKNLEIGLALVNTLSLGEFRAVLAHEFGHFTQRSMAVARWAYVAHQVAAHLVARRDKLDTFLVQLSRFDLRVAWVGWILSLIVWSIRALVDSAFRGVLVLQHALSREMEMQADLVAVSLTGSDAIVHALQRLHAGDDAWDRTMGFVAHQHAQNLIPQDAFALHTLVMERVADTLGDPAYGRVAPVPADRPERHRVFSPDLAEPPRMWLTHPLNHEREANAKRNYVSAPIDERSAWTLLDNPDELRQQVSAVMLESKDKATVPLDQSLDALNQQFDREFLKMRYRGLYLGRSIVRGAERPGDLSGDAPANWREQLDQLYPETLTDEVARLRSLDKELQQLRAVQTGNLAPPEGGIRHRGRAIRPGELLKVIGQVEREARDVEDRLRAADRLCRSVHLAAASALGNGWAQYLQGLLAVLHYAEHNAANLQDLHAVFVHTFHVVAATRRVSSAGRLRLVEAANALHLVMGDVTRRSPQMQLDTTLGARLPGSWAERVGPYKMPPPDTDNIGEWLDAIPGWVDQVVTACRALRDATLEQLLQTEAAVARHVRDGTVPDAAPTPSVVPDLYDVLLTGAERNREHKLTWWQRFQIADGVVPTVARVAVAGGIVAAVLGFGSTIGTATIMVYNGLAVPVVVHLDGKPWALGPGAAHALPVDGRGVHRIETRAPQEQVIDTLTVDMPGSFATFVYNVAGASPLMEWTQTYGSEPARRPRFLGAPRWTQTSAEVLFTDPPERISTRGGGGARLVLSGAADATPPQQLGVLRSGPDSVSVIRAHARWDATSSGNIAEWWSMAAATLLDLRELIVARLEAEPYDIMLLRMEQDVAPDSARPRVCARHQAASAAAPADADLHYVSVRCLADSVQQARAFLDGHQRWPTHGWFAYAAGYDHLRDGQWREAGDALETARREVPAFAEFVAVDLARLHRWRDSQPSPALTKLLRSSSRVRSLVALESGAGLDSSPLLAYRELARGNLTRALDLAAVDPDLEARVLRLAASSDGAPPQLIRRALALGPAAGLDDGTRWASIGLATRLGRDLAPFTDALRPGERELVEQLLRSVRSLSGGADVAVAERELRGVPLALRGAAYSIGVIALGTRAPAAWRHGAKQILFVSERPYFR